MDKFLDRLRQNWRGSVPFSDNYGRDVIAEWMNSTIGSRPISNCLDIGCGDGQDLAIVKGAFPDAALYGLDIAEENVRPLEELGVHTGRTNLEVERLSFPDEVFDLVIANQVFEHLKNWVFALSEVTRVLKPDGLLIIGVPNLASLHNRLMLMLGKQPTCIDTSGMHVRGFTFPGLAQVVEYKHVFRIIDHQGRVFFPFPKRAGLMMSHLWPTAASSMFLLCERIGDPSDLGDIESIQKQEELSLI